MPRGAPEAHAACFAVTLINRSMSAMADLVRYSGSPNSSSDCNFYQFLMLSNVLGLCLLIFLSGGSLFLVRMDAACPSCPAPTTME